ncbi:MAG: inositol monophosphatase [Bacteroidales bacterium]|nr:inositol monophosphatase [Bacteroidales bacterium]
MIKDLKISVEEIAKQAGEIIRKSINSNKNIDIQKKGLNDFVTEIDKKSEIFIVNKLKELLPNSGFIAEENTIKTQNREYIWIIDPLDGTMNFIHGLYPCAVSIALMKNNEIILGVVYEIGLDECFSATKNNGAFLNGKKIEVSKTKNLSNSLVGTGFPYNDFKNLGKYLNTLEEFIKNSQGVRRPGSAASDLAYVACGRYDAFFEYNLQSYDVAAGSIILSEAGGKLSDFSNTDNYIFGKEIIGTNPFVFEEVLEIISRNFKL